MVLSKTPFRTRLTRHLTFHAIHRMTVAGLSDDENRERFGWTSDLPGHGHLYRVSVTVGCESTFGSGMVMNLSQLDEILASQITDRFSGRHLNEVLPATLSGEAPPTCEAIATEIFTTVAKLLPKQVNLDRVRVAEDETLEAECLGTK